MSKPVLTMTITSQDDAVSLVLSNQQVSMKLSDKVIEDARREMRDDPDTKASGWVGGFTRFVTGAVDRLISSSIDYSLDDITSVTVADGRLVFTYAKRHMLTFEDVKISENGSTIPALATFALGDAQAFAEAFAQLKQARAK